MSAPAMMEGETTSKRAQNEIWRCLFDDKVAKIGVHGMGGAGKTTVVEHINNRLLEEKDKSDKVIWVTVSSNSSIRALQDKLAHKLEVDISRFDDDEEARAHELRRGFLKSKRYVLILDDLWQVEHDSLKKIGIPDPTPDNGCKLILTTRFLGVCRTVNCDVEILMNLLSEEEALELFLEKVGADVTSNPKLEELVKQVTRECARLPLAIITVAGALRKETEPCKWEVALEELKYSSGSESSEVMRNLKKSYDWLNDKKHKDCLLYCALYPEDYSIEKSLLVDQLIANGIVEDTKTRKYQVASVCLLIDSVIDEGDPSVKMHDLVRDMAIQIMRETPEQFLIKAGEKVVFVPDEKYWNEDLEKVTLMGSNIVEISSSIDPPKCPKVSTLFLNSNRLLETIPSNFFSHMKALSVLNLSRTGIRTLPESVSLLVNLAILLLEGCKDLFFVPSLANLTNMKRLDMSGTAIIKVPEGLEMMIKLTHLNLSETRLRQIPYGTLCKLTNLQFLSYINKQKVTVGADEFSNLGELETFEACLDFESFKSILSSLEKKQRGYINMRISVLPEWEKTNPAFIKQNKNKLFKCEIKCDFPLLLPKNIEELYMDSCNIHGALFSQIFSLDNEASLTEVTMYSCTNMEYLFHYSPFQRLEKLSLVDMPDLLGLVFIERPLLPLGSFSSSLTHLSLENCPKLKKLFNSGDPSLPNLKVLRILGCDELEEIVSLESDVTAISLPKLRDLRLYNLAKVKSIPIEAEALREIRVFSCPLIQEFHPIDREPYPPSLRNVYIGGCSWDSEGGIEWNWNDFNATREMERSDTEFICEYSEEDC